VLNLTPHQVRQAETQRKAADDTVGARLPETYQWLLAPVQPTPQAAVGWQAIRLTGHDPLAVRASRKLRNDELLVTGFAGTRLRMELDRIPLWRGEHVEIRQLQDDFARYVYLPRLAGPEVLLGAVADGLSLLTWVEDGFAYADGYDEAEARYRGLRKGQHVPIAGRDPRGLLVKPEVALRQVEPKRPEPQREDETSETEKKERAEKDDTPPPPPAARRFHGTVELDCLRAGRDASTVAEEVIAHLAGLVGATVRITLEIDAVLPAGAPDRVIRTVTENCRTLKFTSHGFESE